MGNAALLIIDMQEGLFLDRENPIYEEKRLLETIGDLIGRAHSAGVPVFFIQQWGEKGHILEAGTPAWQIHHEIRPSDGDIIIRKHTPDSFHETNLQNELDVRGIRKLVITGIHTAYCVDTTCRRAYILGYDVVLVKDGHSTVDTDLLGAIKTIEHHNEVMGYRFADIIAAADINFDEIV
jgi:nicotinamidase-related amidase